MTKNKESNTELELGENLRDRPECKDLRIIRLEIGNVKRIKTAVIEPDGAVVVIGGKNGAGKSSAIDSIAYALGGKALCPDVPIRRGAKRGFVKVDLGEFTVERIFTKGGSRLEVKNAKGFTPPGGPQELLEKTIGKMQLEFDPVAFLDKSRSEQLEIIKRLAGVDCADLDEKRAKAYDQRTDVNRDVKALKARLDAMPHHDDTPDEEESVSALVAELDRRREVNEQNENKRDTLATLKECGIEIRKCVESIDEQIARLEKERGEQSELLAIAVEAYKTRRIEVDVLQDEDLDEVRNRIDAAEETNRRVRENQARIMVDEDLAEARLTAASYTDAIDEFDAERKKRIAAANLPVEGLGFDKDCVTFNDLPLDQAGEAERTRVAVAIALALSGKLKIALVRNGSALDEDSFARLCHEVKAARGSLWLEDARAGDEATVVFEDGEVVG